MLNDGSGFKKVYLATGYTDLRRGMEGLAAIIRFQFELDPYDKNTLFLLRLEKSDSYASNAIRCTCASARLTAGILTTTSVAISSGTI